MMKFVALVSWMATISLSAYGQTQTTGSIAGVVHDQTMAAIPGVDVTAQNEGTGLKRSAVTDETGSYMLAVLPVGQYTVTFALPGFRTMINRGVTVNATEKITLNGKLQIADIDSKVEVSDTAQFVQTETTALGRVIDSRITTSLPLPTKNYTQLLALSTGVAAGIPDTAAVGRGSVNVSVNGAASNANAFLLDGVDANNIHTNNASENSLASNGVPVPSSETIQEFKVQAGLYDAQYGRNSGSNINVVTKSGTNEFHGALYYYFRNEVLNANDFFFNRTHQPRPILRQNQYGGTIGGKLHRDRTFFFLGFQGTRQLNGASASRSTRSLQLPPIPAQRTPATLGQVFGGLSGTRGGVAIASDGSNINPVALALLNARLKNGDYLIPSPQTTGPGVNYSISLPATYEEEQVSLSLDHDFAPNHRGSVRLFGANTPQVVGLSGDLPGFALTQDFKNRNLSITDTYTITPRVVNEARAGFGRPAGITLYEIPVTAQQIGLNRFNRDTVLEAPTISVSGAFTLGYSGNVPQMTVPNIFTFQDTLSFTKGAHFMRTGAEMRRHQSNIYNNFNWRGTVNFLSMPDFLLGMPGGPGGNGTSFSNISSNTILSGQTYRNYRARDVAFFFQDDWKVMPQLTLNLGVRYDFLGPMSDRYGRMANFDPRLYQAPPTGGQTSSGFVLPRNTKFTIPGVTLPLVNDYLIDNAQKLNFAPRFGLAYRPSGAKSFVIRAGYGMFYDRASNNPVLQTITSPPFATFYSNSGAAISFASFANPFPVLPKNEEHPVTPVIYAPPNNAERRLVSVFSLDHELGVPYLQHYSLNIQYEVARNFLLEVGYVGSKGTHLPRTVTINQPILASSERPVNGITTNTAANAADRVPYIGFSPTNLTQVQTQGDSHYDSLQASMTKRMSSGLQFLASYTWSKNLGDSGSGDALDRQQSRGPSGRKHRFVYSYLYDIPAWGFGLNRTAFGNKFFKGWKLTGVATVQSGSYFNISDSTGARLFGSSSSRASYASGATTETAKLQGSVTDRLERYFNTAAFVAAGDLWGNTGPGIMVGPGQKNVDLALIKDTPFRERKSVEWRMEVFNVTNTPNFGNPSGSLTSSSFGTITSTVANARLIQFGLRILY